MAKMLLTVAWITIAAAAVSGCATSEAYLPAITKFRTGTERTAAAMKPYFLEINRSQRREVFALARLNDQPIALRKLQPVIDPVAIQVGSMRPPSSAPTLGGSPTPPGPSPWTRRPRASSSSAPGCRDRRRQ